MKTKVKYEKFKGEEVGWFQKTSPKVISRTRSPNPIIQKQAGHSFLKKSQSETNLTQISDKLTYLQYLGDKNAKIIALLENKR